MLRAMLTLGNEHVLKPFDLKVVRRSRVPSFAESPLSERKRIAFFHPPKCGGTSVNRWLALAFGGPAGLDPLAAETAARSLGISGWEVREALLAYFVQRKDARFISGHYSYSSRAFSGREDEFDFLTILRNPLDRMLSHYYYNRFREERDHFPIETDLPNWLATDQARMTAMTFTRMFVGDITVARALDSNSRSGEVRAAVSDAMTNLSKFAVVGTLERLDEFEEAIRARYDIKSSIDHLRKSPKPGYLKFADQPREVQDRILELCRGDLDIYERFSKQP
ncbi:MAG TPA: sulfotransferase family 2 domain-containing protein [Dongiaceae bacterium]|nr:sulfotransferase family 2 domain-containing protein [Dongiaceae bacterium]